MLLASYQLFDTKQKINKARLSISTVNQLPRVRLSIKNATQQSIIFTIYRIFIVPL
jgi:hypothetical protein